jgi:DNA polymerase
MEDKAQQYSHLVQSRKTCHLCSGLINTADVRGGRWDSDEIGPWSRWQGNLNAQLMIVGQDWGDISHFTKWEGNVETNNPTNMNLRELLASIGIHTEWHEQPGRSQVFLTNAILCLKQGGMQANVEDLWFANCVHRFLRPTIELVSPAVVVALGEKAFKAILLDYEMPLKKGRRFREWVEQAGQEGGIPLPREIRLFPVYHCGAGGINRNRNMILQKQGWQPIGRALRTVPPHPAV